METIRLREPSLWGRLAGRGASERDLPSRELECLERAPDAEFRALPEVINLERIREDYGRTAPGTPAA